MKNEFVSTGGARTGGYADASLVHSSATSQTWAFVFTAIVMLIFAIVDAFRFRYFPLGKGGWRLRG